jgi:hypothetical protein
MATKLGKKQYPSGHGADDFECFGPPASKDGAFDSTKIADMGCFKQDGSDTNKYYHASVVKSKNTGVWFAYYEWGRTGGTKDFMFVQCSSESEAQATYEKQCHAKNTKRGEWAVIAGINTLRAKKNRDCYLVRPMATRSTGLPDAAHIQSEEGGKAPAKTAKKTAKKKTAKKSKPALDPQTMSLMRDMNVAVVKYTRGQMADESIPTQVAIDEGRDILAEALKVVAKSRKRIGMDAPDDEHLAAQIKSKSLIELTNVMYSRIPKVKRRRTVDRRGQGKATEAAKKAARKEDAKTFILTQDNIMLWQADLDAFEAAKLTTTNVEAKESNPLDGMGVEMNWVNINSSEWSWLKDFCAKSTRNRHGGLGAMNIKNVWAVRKPTLETGFLACQKRISGQKPRTNEKPMFEPKKRPDLNGSAKEHSASRTALLFHGTRSVNVSGILTKSLLLPKQLVGVQITGAMYGPGLYFADDWKKSAGYCSLRNSYWAGGSDGVKGRSAFMFLVDTVLGKPHVAAGPSGYTKPPTGTNSVFGKAGRYVQNNEWIVYDSNQHALKYLVEFDA